VELCFIPFVNSPGAHDAVRHETVLLSAYFGTSDGYTGWILLGGVAAAFAQDVMQQRLPFLKVVAEDDKVRVLRDAPAAGDKSADAAPAVLADPRQLIAYLTTV
jgi:hypothetical protein